MLSARSLLGVRYPAVVVVVVIANPIISRISSRCITSSRGTRTNTTTTTTIPNSTFTTTISSSSSSSSSSSLPSSPSPSQHHHHDLQSFLAYANRTSLSPTTTTYVGTHYEYTICQSLQKYGFNLTRIGGSNDLGIDLVGTWDIIPSPSSSSSSSTSAQPQTNTYSQPTQPLRVLVQCKALKKKTGPNLIRELEGTFAGAPPGWRGHGVFGVLATTRPATKGVRDAMAKSRYPLVWILAEQASGKVRQCLWNQRAVEKGLAGLGIVVRHGGGEEVDGSVGFTWAGEEIGRIGR